MSNYFSAEIKAPSGLEGIQEHLSGCDLEVEPWESGYNGKIILKPKSEATFEWSMDSSDSEILFISGEFYDGEEIAIKKLQSLSTVLKNMLLPHVILLDDKNSMLLRTFSYEWNKNM